MHSDCWYLFQCRIYVSGRREFMSREDENLCLGKTRIYVSGRQTFICNIIDSTLSWKQQIKNITCKISRAIGVMYELRPFLNSTMIKNIYYSIIYSHIVYAIQLWAQLGKLKLTKYLSYKNILLGKVHDIFNISIAKFI